MHTLLELAEQDQGDKGASAIADRDGHEPSPTVSASGDHPLRNEPDWLCLAGDMAAAIMFQRSTRRVHIVGKDGRTRMGCVDLMGCYAVDEAARLFCEAVGDQFQDLEPPTEEEAMFMLSHRLTWRHWLGDKAGVRALMCRARDGSGVAGETGNTGSTRQGDSPTLEEGSAQA